MRTFSASTDRVLGSPVRNLLVVLSFVFTVGICATIAYRLAGWSWLDAFYMVTITIYTVGYGEIQPINTPYLHAVTIITMMLGCTGMIVLTGVLVQIFTVLQVKQFLGIDRVKKQIEKLDNHVIICGFGRIGTMLAKDLQVAGTGFIVIERDEQVRAEADALGFLTLAGDATEEATLINAGIDRARVLATVLPNDAANVFITLTARSLSRSIEIIARGEAPTTENKLVHAGANRVVLPTHIGAERIAELILFPATSDFISGSTSIQELKRGMSVFGLEIEVVTAVPDGMLTGLTVIAAEKQGGGAFFVVQLDKQGSKTILHPGPDVLIEPDDTVVLVVRAGRSAAGTKFSTPRSPVRVGRNMV